MNLAGIRQRVVERMAEYDGGGAESSGGASLTDATIYSRISDVFRDLIAEVAERDPMKVADVASLSYPANTEATDLPAAVQYRPIFTVEELVGSDYYPIEAATEFGDRRARQDGGVAGDTRWWTRRAQIALTPTPGEAKTLRIRYLPAVDNFVPGSSEAVLAILPVEHRPLLALLVAQSFLVEVGRGAGLDREVSERQERFWRWAAGSPKTGPRFVAGPL